MAKKYVYFFGNGKAEGEGTQKDLLGGKGAGLAGMSRAGVPVPRRKQKPLGRPVVQPTGRPRGSQQPRVVYPTGIEPVLRP